MLRKVPVPGLLRMDKKRDAPASSCLLGSDWPDSFKSRIPYSIFLYCRSLLLSHRLRSGFRRGRCRATIPKELYMHMIKIKAEVAFCIDIQIDQLQ